MAVAHIRPSTVSGPKAKAKEPPETDLDYYSRPENYSGSDMLHTMQHAMIRKKTNVTASDSNIDMDNTRLAAHKRLVERYRTFAFDDESGISLTNNHSSDGPYQNRRDSTDHSLPHTHRIFTRKISVVGMEGTLEQTPNRSASTSREPSRRTSRVSMHNLSPAGSVSNLSRPGTAPRPSRELDSPGAEDSPSQRLIPRVRSSLVSSPGRHHTRYSYATAAKTAAARDRFRHATKIVLILLKWISSLSEKGDGGDGGEGGRTFTDIANEAFTSDELKNSGLSFDLSKFKAKREVNISTEVKSILSIPSHQRMNDQIQTALIGLQHMKSFAEYPLHMQEKLCKVAWFQLVPPKRVIIRQGHYAENFYFILSGQAMVRILDKNPQTGDAQLRTAAIMKKGTSFGEMALLHHSMRTATVVSQDQVQLLAIGRDDFFDIFMSRSGPDGMPDHIRFVSQLDFMRDWPIQNLLEHPECCLFHFFKRGVVIVKDSGVSDWLYLVKSGSCQVMKELKGVRTSVAPGSKRKERQSAGTMLPKLGTGEARSKIDTGRGRRQCVTPDHARSDRFILRKSHSAIRWQRGFGEDDDDDEEDCQEASQEVIKPVLLTVPPAHEGPGYSKSRFQKFLSTSQRGSFAVPGSIPPLPPGLRSLSEGGISRSASASPRMRSPRAKTARKDAELEVPVELRGPVFVQVEVLKPKDCFGLTSIQFDDDVETAQTSVSLVSNGAECIMLSKKFFAMHANDKVKKSIRYNVRPYPSERALQENLQTKVDWDIYKKKLIKGMLAQKAREEMMTSNKT